jgi:hypothetical protein
LFYQIQQFEQNFKHMSLDQVQHKYQALDLLRCNITATVESKCRKLRKGNVAFSPTLNAARLLNKAWQILNMKAKGKKISIL